MENSHRNNQVACSTLTETGASSVPHMVAESAQVVIAGSFRNRVAYPPFLSGNMCHRIPHFSPAGRPTESLSDTNSDDLADRAQFRRQRIGCFICHTMDYARLDAEPAIRTFDDRRQF